MCLMGPLKCMVLLEYRYLTKLHKTEETHIKQPNPYRKKQSLYQPSTLRRKVLVFFHLAIDLQISMLLFFKESSFDKQSGLESCGFKKTVYG